MRLFIFSMCFGCAVLSKTPPFFLLYDFCTTSQCKEVGAHIDYSLNKTAPPCDDFYEFACGGWVSKTKQPSSEPVWSYWQSIGNRISERIKTILELTSGTNEDEPLKKAQLAYKPCVTEENSRRHLRDLKDLIASSLGGWPLISAKWDDESFNWALQIARVRKLTGVQAILKMFPEIDFSNTSRHVLYVQPGHFNLPLTILKTPEKHVSELNKYRLWIYQSVKYLYRNKTSQYLKSDASKIINFEIKLAKLSTIINRFERVSIKNLSEETGLEWLTVFNSLSENYNFTSTDQVLVHSVRYLTKLVYLINRTDKSTVANYIIWSVVKDLSRDTTNFMRSLSFLMDNSILGIKSDIPHSAECINKINEYIPLAVIAKYVNLFLKPGAIEVVNDMVRNIKIEFVEMLQRNTWLSTRTKRLAIEKIIALKHHVGYPDWAENLTYMKDYYEQLNVTDNHFLNILRMKEFVVRNDFLKLSQPVDKAEWPSSPLDVNAYYSVLQNSIIIPLGILEPPFFDIDRPQVFNYGALGALIGHEISHALDTTGRKADKTGQISHWWQKPDIAEYEKRSTCFENQYNEYGIDGYETVGENIADSVGLEISFRAFYNLKTNMRHVIVPHLETFTKEQLHFISFAQLWCEISNDNVYLNEGEHSPVKQRVLGTLYNNEEFHTAFQCRKSTTRCELW